MSLGLYVADFDMERFIKQARAENHAFFTTEAARNDYMPVYVGFATEAEMEQYKVTKDPASLLMPSFDFYDMGKPLGPQIFTIFVTNKSEIYQQDLSHVYKHLNGGEGYEDNLMGLMEELRAAEEQLSFCFMKGAA